MGGIFGGGPDPASSIKAQGQLAETARNAAVNDRGSELSWLTGGPSSPYEQQMQNLVTQFSQGSDPYKWAMRDRGAAAMDEGAWRLQKFGKQGVIPEALSANMLSRGMANYQSPAAQQYASRLSKVAMGKVPTSAEILGEAQAQRANRDISSMASRAGAFNPAAIRAAVGQQANTRQDMANTVLGNAINERNQAAQIGSNFENQQGALRNQVAGLATNAGLGERQLQQQAAALAQQAGQGMLGTSFDMDQNLLNNLRTNMLDRYSFRTGAENQIMSPYVQAMAPAASMYGTQMQGHLGQQQAMMGLLGGGLGGLGALLMSDQTAKEDIKPGEQEIKSFLGALKPYEYKYKKRYQDPQVAPDGQHVSVMAQDLEKTKIGKRAVVEREDGIKMVDYGKAAPAMLASLAYINERLGKLEGKK